MQKNESTAVSCSKGLHSQKAATTKVNDSSYLSGQTENLG